MDDGGRCQKGQSAPGVSGGTAGGMDDVAAELGGEVLSQRIEGAVNPSMHGGASCAMRTGKKHHSAPKGHGYLKAKGRLGLHGLNAIRLIPFMRQLLGAGVKRQLAWVQLFSPCRSVNV